MESAIIKESIDDLIKARPSVSTASASDGSSVQTKTPDSLFNTDNRHLSMRRRSAAVSSAKCNCGRCSKCIPSPSGKRANRPTWVKALLLLIT
jgi:hypothetical protein